jgi:hypothetical protein
MRSTELFEQRNMMLGDSAARRLAKQIVRSAKRQFSDKDELAAAKRMAKAFHANLVACIDEEHRAASTKPVDDTDD